jgi:cathepsin B
MRPVHTLIDLQSVPTLEALGGPPLDLTRALPAKFGWSGITPVLDQGHCGACWAFASVAALNDRFIIWSSLRMRLSPYKMLVCNMGGLEHDLDFDDGTEQINSERRALAQFECRGNSLEDAWRYLFTNGVPELDCVPPDVLGNTCTQVVGQKENACPTGKTMRSFRCRAYYSVPAAQVMHEIYQRGPVSAAFAVARDFWDFDFKSGVYEPTSVGGMGHAVRIVGWGESPAEGPWWWVVNSFGPDWGVKGLFRMRRGYLETNVIAGLPDTFGKAPLFSLERDRLFRQRVERMYGLDELTGRFGGSGAMEQRPLFFKAPTNQLRAPYPVLQTDSEPNEPAPVKTQAQNKDGVDLNLTTSLYEDTHAIFRIAIFVLALLCVVFLWFRGG